MIFVACLIFVSTSLGQEATKSNGLKQSAESDQEVEAMPLLLQTIPDYKTTTLTGDWGGARTELAEQGITFDLSLTQILQGNAHGGKDTNSAFRYSGSTDYILTFDTARLGLWPAGSLKIHGETQFGQSINSKVGSLMSANADALFPVPDDTGITTLTEVVYTQFFSEHFGIQLGKIDFRSGDTNVFANSETTQFMNLAFLANPCILNFAPYSALTATVIFRPTDWLTTVVNVIDTNGSPTETGFNTAFHSPQGTTIINEWDFTIKPFGLPGHQRFGWVWTSKDQQLFNQNARIPPLAILQRQLGGNEMRSDNYCVYWNFDQYVHVEEEDPTQGVGVFGRFGWAPEEVNAINTFYSIGVGGKGIVPKRDNDTFGIGYYYMNLSDDLPSFLGMNSEQGVEVYYNIEITPWMHITPDLQVIINPGGGDNDVAVVYGMRMQMAL